MADHKLAGLHSALMTPYDHEGVISESGLRRLVDSVFAQGLDGLYVGGSTGESLLQTTEERRQVLSLAAEAADGRGALIGHVGAVGTREAQALAKHCAAQSYDAVSAIPPIYFNHSKAGIKAYYQSIIEAADGLPLIVYNIPAMSGVRFSLDDLASLIEMPGTIGVKQTTIDMYQMEQLRRRYPDLLLLNGYDEMLLAGLASGANGGIGSTYNIIGSRYVAMRKHLRDGDLDAARSKQHECNAIIDVLVEFGVFPALKYLLYKTGVIETPICLAPLDTLGGEGLGKLDAVAATLMAEA